MSFQFHRCTSKVCRQNWWPCSLVLPTWISTSPLYPTVVNPPIINPPVVNSVLAIEVHMSKYFLRRKPVSIKPNILYAGYEIVYLPLVKLLAISTFFVHEEENQLWPQAPTICSAYLLSNLATLLRFSYCFTNPVFDSRPLLNCTCMYTQVQVYCSRRVCRRCWHLV